MVAELDNAVTVPDFVGLAILDARGLAIVSEVVLTSGSPDGPTLGSLTWPGHFVVTGQHPLPGQQIERHGFVQIDFERRDGGSGDREPRLPIQPLDALSQQLETRRTSSKNSSHL